MGQLKLRQSCYKGIENSSVKEICRTSIHKTLVDEANKEIEENRIRYATAYNKARFYLVN